MARPGTRRLHAVRSIRVATHPDGLRKHKQQLRCRVSSKLRRLHKMKSPRPLAGAPGSQSANHSNMENKSRNRSSLGDLHLPQFRNQKSQHSQHSRSLRLSLGRELAKKSSRTNPREQMQSPSVTFSMSARGQYHHNQARRTGLTTNENPNKRRNLLHRAHRSSIVTSTASPQPKIILKYKTTGRTFVDASQSQPCLLRPKSLPHL